MASPPQQAALGASSGRRLLFLAAFGARSLARVEAVSCPLCRPTTSASPYHEERGWKAVQCGGCGLVYVTPRPSAREILRRYEAGESHVDVGGEIRSRHAKTAEAQASLARIQRHVRAGRLLDVGAGAGYLVAEARARGFDAVALEPNGRFVRFAREALRIPVIHGTPDARELDGASFDVVFHRNLLSHLADPVRDVSRLAGLLAPGGVMVLETGNVAELPGRTFRGTCALDLPDHLFHYSETTLRALLARSGLEVLEVRRLAVLSGLVPFGGARRALRSLVPRRERGGVRSGETAPPRRAVALWAALAAQRLAERAAGALASRTRRCSLLLVARRAGSASRSHG